MKRMCEGASRPRLFVVLLAFACALQPGCTVHEKRERELDRAGRDAAPSDRAAQGDHPESGDEAGATSRREEDTPQESSEADTSDGEEIELKDEEVEFDVSGLVSLSYRARVRGDRNDEDLYGYISLDGGSRAVNDVTFHAYGRATFDLDGDHQRPNAFFSLDDVFGHRLDGRLYEAFVELRRSLVPGIVGIEQIRLGRQNVHAGYTYLVDGARVDFRPVEKAGDLHVGIYGGIPELLYESSTSGDWLAGMDVDLSPFESTRIDLRYVHAEEQNGFSNRELEDDYLSLSVRQEFGESLSAVAEWNTLDFATRDVRLALAWDVSEYDLSVRFSYRFQNDIMREFTTPYDPFTSVLGRSFAHHRADLQVSKLFGKHLGLDAGVSGRFLHDGNDAPFNREFVRGWVTLTAYKWPADELEIAVTGEVWSADEDESATAGIEMTWRPTDRIRISTGSYYSLYKYDLFVVDERGDVTTIFIKARWKALEELRLDGRYEFETGDEGTFHTVWLGLTWSF